MITLGVIADTHIPDRRQSLHPAVIPLFREAGLHAILHAGDISIPKVLTQLEEVAPVYAVRGNRDWYALRDLPTRLSLNLSGVQIAVAHGHGRFKNYLIDKIYISLRGLHENRFTPRLQDDFTAARVIVFGHLHLRINRWENGQLLFNPGTACCINQKGQPPSVGLLNIDEGGEIRAEILDLE